MSATYGFDANRDGKIDKADYGIQSLCSPTGDLSIPAFLARGTLVCCVSLGPCCLHGCLPPARIPAFRGTLHALLARAPHTSLQLTPTCLPQIRPTKPPAREVDTHYWHQYVSREVTLGASAMTKHSMSPCSRPFEAPSKLSPGLKGWPSSGLKKSASMNSFYSSRSRTNLAVRYPEATP